jgi:hypothetical protein
MRARCLAAAVVIAAALVPGRAAAGGQTYWEPATAAARELARQLDFLQQTVIFSPATQGRGLTKQISGIQIDLTYFREQLKNKVSREELYLAFEKMDNKLTALLGEIQNAEKWSPPLKYVARRVQSADHDLHVALSLGDTGAKRQGQAVYRQTLALLGRVEDLAYMVQYVFEEQEALQRWTGPLKDLRREVKAFQKAQQDKASRDDLKQQLVRLDEAWDRIVALCKEVPGGQYFLLQGDASRVDALLGRLDSAFGLKDRRARLPSSYFD